jgi:hypothetical protein
MSDQEIALKVLISQRHMSYEAFCREWDRVAGNTDDALKGHYPGRAQYYRWLRGDLANKRPYPDACRMLEAMFPGWPVERLFSPYVEKIPQTTNAQIQNTITALGVGSSFSERYSGPTPTGVTGELLLAIDLSGVWWASWQTFRDGAEKMATQQVECRQSGGMLQLVTITHGLSLDEGGYHWSGELRLWDNEILMGWYVATEESVRSKGTMYFVLHPHGLHMAGRWVGLGYDGRIMTGWGAMGKTRESAETVVDRLKNGIGGANA